MGRVRWTPIGGLLLVVALVVAACGGDDAGDDRRSVAILRTVPSAEVAIDAFLSELADRGYRTGDNLTVRAGGLDDVHPDPAEARETVRKWVADGVDVIVALSTLSAQAAAEAAPDTPVVFLVNDPATSGLVENERSPEGHLTGTTFRVPADRTLSIALDALGEIDRIGCLYPTGDPAAEPSVDAIVAGADALDIDVDTEPFASPDEVPAALRALADRGADAVLLASAPATVQAFPALTQATPEVGIPLVANTELDAALLVLQPERDTVYRQLARQTARLFGGAEVAETPVEDPGRYELIVNLAVAEQLGLELPDRFVESADRVIR